MSASLYFIFTLNDFAQTLNITVPSHATEPQDNENQHHNRNAEERGSVTHAIINHAGEYHKKYHQKSPLDAPLAVEVTQQLTGVGDALYLLGISPPHKTQHCPHREGCRKQASDFTIG